MNNVSVPKTNLTPMMQQWAAAKSQQQDAIVLFRMGDFYELFGDDAQTAAPILDLTITSRDKDKSGLKMAGFPAHAATTYIQKLVDDGHKVAICEQLEDPKNCKGIVKRGIVEVLTPGLCIAGEDEQDTDFSYLLGLTVTTNSYGLCALDIKTGTFLCTASDTLEAIFDEALRLRPKEIVVAAADADAQKLARNLTSHTQLKGIRIEIRNVRQAVTARLQAILTSTPAEVASGVTLVWDYVSALKGEMPEYVGAPKFYSLRQQLLLDVATQENLDLFPKKKGDQGNLYCHLNRCKTAMGKRRLQESLRAPATDLMAINQELAKVCEMVREHEFRHACRDTLSGCYDIEKLTALAAAKKVGPRGMVRLKECLAVASQLKVLAALAAVPQVRELLGTLPDLAELHAVLTEAIREDAPVTVKDGGIFKTGHCRELDDYAKLRDEGGVLLLALEAAEREKLQIPSLKVRYTRVFGYYIEITKSHLHKVPDYYQRKQTIAGGERFISAELSELEINIKTAQAKCLELEQELFDRLVAQVANRASDLMRVGQIVARLDMLSSFAELSWEKNYVKPEMLPQEDQMAMITAGRHPIVEELCNRQGSLFVANDVAVSGDCLVALITGPNMAGKSTVMRQTALIQIMAQMGCFVPATSATLSICDAIFARVGASDDLASGRSTFMVEMSETAYILSNASPYSMILLDEIGRGTSTYDGMAIAQAVVEYVSETLKARTLFATHYHELTSLEARYANVRNFHVEVANEGEIKFLYTLASGPATESFGVHVAKLAGLPPSLITRAHEILYSLEKGSQKIDQGKKTLKKRNQLSLFAEQMGN